MWYYNGSELGEIRTYACLQLFMPTMGHEFDQFQHFTDDALTVCPACNEVALRKVYTPVGIVLKARAFTPLITALLGTKSSYKSDSDSSNGSKSKQREQQNALIRKFQ